MPRWLCAVWAGTHSRRLAERRPPLALSFGFDPGTRITGYALVDAEARQIVTCGVIKLSVKEPMYKRMAELHHEVALIVDAYKEVELAGVETPFVGKHLNAVIPVSMARGVILAAAAAGACECSDIAPAEVKKAMGAGGAASKVKIQHAVKAIFGLGDILPTDVSDAVAIAYITGLRAACPVA